MASEEEQRKTISLLLSRRQTPTEISTTLGCSRSTVYRVKQRGAFKKDAGDRPRPQRRPEVVLAVQEEIGIARGGITIRGLAKEFNLAETTMRRLVKEDLGLQCFKRRPRMAL